tara:strand:- start:334 stop:507 length:174 start_codon:yes stop_codon:yes gene_type:complete
MKPGTLIIKKDNPKTKGIILGEQSKYYIIFFFHISKIQTYWKIQLHKYYNFYEPPSK